MIKELLKRPIAYNPIVAKAFGSVKLGILWSQIYYWSDKTNDPNGWIYKTQNDIFDETGLSRKEQETARKLGKKLGILESEVRGVPPKVNFRVDIDKTIELLEDYSKCKKTKKGNVVSKYCSNELEIKAEKKIKPVDFNRRFFEEAKNLFTKGVEIEYDVSKWDIETPLNEIRKWLEEKKVVITRKDIEEFVLYWTEPNKSGTKERWETEKTFDVRRRLIKWMDNKSKWSKTTSVGRKNVVV